MTEIRMRAGKPLVVQTLCSRFVVKNNGLPCIASSGDIEGVIARASNFSVYSVGDEMKRGYISYGKYRIGIAGEGVMEDGKFLSVKNISSLVIRIPHQVSCAADAIDGDVLTLPLSTLVISPPGAGKTTLLRELARLASSRFNTVVIDERYELSAMSSGKSGLDVGESDVVCGVPKSVAYESCVRALNPDIVVTDEVFLKSEIEAIQDLLRAGVKVFASVHGESIGSLEKNVLFAPLVRAFEYVVVLSKRRRAGEIVECRRL